MPAARAVLLAKSESKVDESMSRIPAMTRLLCCIEETGSDAQRLRSARLQASSVRSGRRACRDSS
jgi:hypothetical protein